MALLIAGCSSANVKPATTTERHGPLTVTEYISPMESANADANRVAAIDQIQAPQLRIAQIEHRAAHVSEALAPFGFQIKQNSGGMFELYQGERLLRRGFSLLSPPSVSATGDDFVMAIGDVADETWLLRPDGLQEWDFGRAMWVPPVFAGDRLVAVTADDRQSVVITVDGKEAYRAQLPARTQYPVKRLGTWGDRWVLELLDQIVVEGKPLPNQESFGWHLMAGRPLHLFRKNGSYGIAYDGQEWPLGYREVVRHACCEGARLNPVLSGDGISFFAYKEKAWRLVLVKVEPKPQGGI